MAFADTLIAVIVLVSILYVIYNGLRAKNPKLPPVGEVIPNKLYDDPPKMKEGKQQIWNDRQSMI